MINFLNRLWPERFRRRPVLTDEKRRELFSTVSDNDNCLRAVMDRLEETLETEFYAAIDPQRPDVERLRACEGLRVSFWNLTLIERERQQARQWREEREQGKAKG